MNAQEINQMRAIIEICFFDAGVLIAGAITGEKEAIAQAKYNKCVQQAKALDRQVLACCQRMGPGETVMVGGE